MGFLQGCISLNAHMVDGPVLTHSSGDSKYRTMFTLEKESNQIKQISNQGPWFNRRVTKKAKAVCTVLSRVSFTCPTVHPSFLNTDWVGVPRLCPQTTLENFVARKSLGFIQKDWCIRRLVPSLKMLENVRNLVEVSGRSFCA